MLIDCHGTGIAAAAMYISLKDQDSNAEPNIRFPTASLHGVYHKPNPLGIEVKMGCKVKKLKGRKVVIDEWLMANGVVTV